MKYTHQDNDRDELRKKTRLRNCLLRLRYGLATFRYDFRLWVWSAAYWLLILMLPRLCASWLAFEPLELKILSIVYVVLGLPAFLALYLCLVALSAIPRHAQAIAEACIRAGLVNSNGEPPFVLYNRNSVIELLSEGIPLAEFLGRKDALETALHLRIARVLQGKDIHRIVLRTAPSNTQLPTKIYLDKVPKGESVITLGMALDGPVNVDLSVMAHMLVGGSTGSGKTYLLLTLIYQFLEKSFSVYILDMKGGADYPRYWREVRCHYSGDLDTILATLTFLSGMLDQRQKRIMEAGDRCNNIDKYNRLNPHDHMHRIAVVCDEMAEITNATGEDKATKEKIAAIIRQLTRLAQVGRSAGFTLVCATQRPDVDAIPAKIRSNLDVRVVGRFADPTLIPSLLGAGKTSDFSAIPLDVPGRFFCNLDNGVILQGYVVKELED